MLRKKASFLPKRKHLTYYLFVYLLLLLCLFSFFFKADSVFHRVLMMMMIMMMTIMMKMMNCFYGMVDQSKFFFYSFSKSGPFPEILIIANIRNVDRRIRTFTVPEFKLCWMKLCSSDHHYSRKAYNYSQLFLN